MAASIAGVFWRAVSLIRECRGRCLPGGAIVRGDEYINSVRAEVARRLKKRSASSAGALSENTPAKRIMEDSC